jgi:hypothetical protein
VNRSLALLVLAAILAASTARAMTVRDVEMTCPIGGEKFKARMAMSGTAFGQNLDRRQVGAIASPWPLAKCPSNGFVLYKREFSDAEIARLAPIVASTEYRALQATETNHYLAAYLKRHLGADPQALFDSLLAATWEAERDGRYPRYAAEALAELEKVLKDPDLSFEDSRALAQLAAELERRLGRFDAAKGRLDGLLPQVRGTDLERLVLQELALVSARDTATHAVEP